MTSGKYIFFLLMLPAMLQGQSSFVEQAVSSGINHYMVSGIPMGGGAAWFDYNNDGWEDVYITGGADRDRLYENQGNGTFVDVGVAAGLLITDNFVTNGVCTGDLDNDGDRDIMVQTSKIFHNLLFENNGDGTFTDISASAGIMSDSSWSVAATFGDANLDGYLDIYVGNYVEQDAFLYDSITNEPNGFAHKCFENYCYLNNGDTGNGISFTRVDQQTALADTGCALAVAFTDFDQDRDADILLANDFGEWVQPNRLFRNDYPANAFSDQSAAASMDAQMYGMGIAVGDYDQDLDLDYYVTNLGRNGLFNNQSDGTFTDVTAAAGVEDTYESTTFTVGWGTSFADIDHDTDLDLFVTNGHVPAFDFIATNPFNPSRLFINEGDGTFSDGSAFGGINHPGRGRGSACADFDKDGDIDWIEVPVNVISEPPFQDKVGLYRNTLSNNHHWLKVKLQGTVNNRDAFGSQIRIVLSDRSWLHEVTGGSSHGSQNSSIAHFGLGTASTVDSLIVSWPGGKEQVLTNISADQQILIEEDETLYETAIDPLGPARYQLQTIPNPFSDQTDISYSLPVPNRVSLRILNTHGQQVFFLPERLQSAGNHRIPWSGIDQNGHRLPSGLYFVQLKIGTGLYSLHLLYIPGS